MTGPVWLRPLFAAPGATASVTVTPPSAPVFADLTSVGMPAIEIVKNTSCPLTGLPSGSNTAAVKRSVAPDFALNE